MPTSYPPTPIAGTTSPPPRLPALPQGGSDPCMAARRLLLLPLLLLNHVVAAAPDNDESSILLDFKNSLQYSDRLSDWDLSSSAFSPCAWTGVLCDVRGRVWTLNLQDMGLRGSIDVGALARLPNLRSLSLMRNNFDGTLPDFSQLASLKAVYLSHNKFSGEIGESTFASSTSLKKLHLADNQLTGPIPASLATLPRLIELTLDRNLFEGRLPEFTSAAQLKLFNVSGNKLSGEIPRSLRNFNANLFSGNELCGGSLDPCSPNHTLTPTANQNHNSSLSLGEKILMILAIVLAVVAILALVLVTIFLLRRIKTLGHHSPPTANKSGNLERGEIAVTPASSALKQAPNLTFLKDDFVKFDVSDLFNASAELLGHGALGSTYKAALNGDRIMVVKRFKHMKGVGREEFSEHMRRLGRLTHPNLLPIIAFYYKKEEKLLVTDYLEHSSLAVRLHSSLRRSTSSRGLDWPTRLGIIKGVARGMDHLHRELPSVAAPHGHLKSSNVVLDRTDRPVLTDYGLITVMSQEHARKHMVAYRSPECGRERQKITAKSDVWSFGLLVLEVLTGKPQLGDSDLAKWIEAILQTEGDDGCVQVVLDRKMARTSHSQGEIAKLIRIGLQCCRKKAAERPEMKEVAEMVDEIKERDGDMDEFFSTYSNDNDIRSSRGISLSADDFKSINL